MIGIVATIRVQEGKGQEFEGVFLELAAAVKANEPGCRMYQLTRSRTEPNTYKVLEIYDSEEALAAHRATEHMRAIGPRMAPAMAGRPDIEILDAVV